MILPMPALLSKGDGEPATERRQPRPARHGAFESFSSRRRVPGLTGQVLVLAH
jgi:hypothetical protein